MPEHQSTPSLNILMPSLKEEALVDLAEQVIRYVYIAVTRYGVEAPRDFWLNIILSDDYSELTSDEFDQCDLVFVFKSEESVCDYIIHAGVQGEGFSPTSLTGSWFDSHSNGYQKSFVLGSYHDNLVAQITSGIVNGFYRSNIEGLTCSARLPKLQAELDGQIKWSSNINLLN